MKNINNIYDIEKDLADQDPHEKTKSLKPQNPKIPWESLECAKR